MSFALLFPGQGAQTPGFLHQLPPGAEVNEVLQQASECLGSDVLTLDSEAALRGTVGVQVSLLIAGVAFTRFLEAHDVAPGAAAGMSVGTFAAAVAARALTLPNALLFVKRRAELMEQAFPGGTHGMAVVEGLRRSQVEQLLLERELRIANENAPAQFVVAGAASDLDGFCVRALEIGAFRAQRLRMAVPSHTEWLEGAADELAQYAATLPVSAPVFPVFSNRTARVVSTAEALREDLVRNMAAPVRWRDIMSGLREFGVETYLEAPPGHSLAALVEANLPGAQVYSAGEVRWDVSLRAARRATQETS